MKKRKQKARKFFKEPVFKHRYVAHFDGACNINPSGCIGTGFYIKEGSEIIHEGSGYFEESPFNSNNTAEYLALESLIDCILEYGLQDEPILILGDSELVCKQMSKVYKVGNGLYVEAALRVHEKAKNLTNVKYRWIPRSQNAYADELSKVEFNKRGIVVIDFDKERESMVRDGSKIHISFGKWKGTLINEIDEEYLWWALTCVDWDKKNRYIRETILLSNEILAARYKSEVQHIRRFEPHLKNN